MHCTLMYKYLEKQKYYLHAYFLAFLELNFLNILNKCPFIPNSHELINNFRKCILEINKNTHKY